MKDQLNVALGADNFCSQKANNSARKRLTVEVPMATFKHHTEVKIVFKIVTNSFAGDLRRNSARSAARSWTVGCALLSSTVPI